MQNSKTAKQRIKQLLLLISFCFFFCISLSSCEKDLYEQSIKNENRKIKITTVNLKDLSKSKDLYSNFISTKNKLNTDNFKSRLTYNTDFGFYIDTDNMKMIESDNFKTLTAQIYRIGKLDKKENLYIHQNNDGSYYAYIFDYTFNEEDINKYVLNQPIDDIIVKTKFKPLDYTVNATSNATSGYNGTVIPYNGYCYTINHVYEGEDGEPWVTLVLCPNCECNSTPNTETLTQDGGGGGGLLNIIYIPGSGISPIGGEGVPTSGSNNSTGNSYNNPVLTTPVISQNMTEIKILSLLNEEQTNWWWFTATKVIKDEIIAFFNSSGFTDENIGFSNEAINTLINNGEVDFSNKIILDSSFTSTKTDCIHKKLKSNTNNFYSQMLSAFDNSTNNNLTFKVGSTTNGDWGITIGSSTSPNNYSITISPDIENGSNLMKIVTLCHELIHAYILSTLESNNLITFDDNGNPLLNISCATGTNYNNINLNTLSVSDRFVALLCAMNQNGTLTQQWTHDLFNSANFNVNTYRQELENLIYNEYDWDNEDIDFKNQAISVFGSNWTHEIAKGVSWVGLENTQEYNTYINSYSTDIPKILYLTNIRNKISTANNNCL